MTRAFLSCSVFSKKYLTTFGQENIKSTEEIFSSESSIVLIISHIFKVNVVWFSMLFDLVSFNV